MRRSPGHAGQFGRTNVSGQPVGNGILLRIPETEFISIRPHLKFERLQHLQILHEPSGKLKFAYFLNSGLVSLMIETKEGKTVEVGIAGNEGIVEIGAVVGLSRSPLREVVQIAGDAFAIEIPALQSSLRSAPELRTMLNRYTVVQCLKVAQTAACSRLHNVEQRFARWLLTLQARSDSDYLAITHDFLAAVLGTDRSSISLAAGDLQRRRIIEYNRGTLKILNRKKLEKFACECYAVIRQLGSESETGQLTAS
jgi:CRP-like cAMP-binding protein